MYLFKEAKESIQFATQYSLLTNATSDNSPDVQGHALEEIFKTSMKHPRFNNQLADYLFNKLMISGVNGKYKAVKLISGICKRGNEDFMRIVKKRDGEIRKAISLVCSHGAASLSRIQKDTVSDLKALLDLLFSSTSVVKELPSLEPMPGYGSAMSSSAYDGFGRSYIDTNPRIFDKLTESVSGLFHWKDSSHHKQRREYEIVKLESFSYEPIDRTEFHMDSIYIPEISYSMSSSTCSERSRCESKRKGRVAGKPGGGWAIEEVLSSSPSLLTSNSVEQTDKESFISPNKDGDNMKVIPLGIGNSPMQYLNMIEIYKSFFANKIPFQIIKSELEKYHAQICKNKKSEDFYSNLLSLLFFYEYVLYNKIFPESNAYLINSVNEIAKVSSNNSKINAKTKKLNLFFNTGNKTSPSLVNK